MALGQQLTAYGASLSPVNALLRSQSDDLDALFGQWAGQGRLVLRLDPRDILYKIKSSNPTGQGQNFAQIPNDDFCYYLGSGISVGVISGKYNGQPVFKLTNSGTAAAKTNSDLRCGPIKAMLGMIEFAVFGAGHIDGTLYGTNNGTPHYLWSIWKDKASIESAMYHQYVTGTPNIDYLVTVADEGDAGGANFNLTAGGATIAADTPFAYMSRFKGTSTGNSRTSLYVNQVGTETAVQSGSGVPDAASTSMELYLGNSGLLLDGNQFKGAHARFYIVSGDPLDTADNIALATACMNQSKITYAIS